MKNNKHLPAILITLLFAIVGTILLTVSSAGPSDPNDPDYPLADTNNDYKVDIFDLSYVLSKWTTNDSTADFNNDGIVNVFDLSYLLAQWGRVDTPGASVPLVIYDTDLGWDIDDAVAFSVLHGYAERGLIEIGATTMSRDSQYAALYADAFNTFYGRPDIPIGKYSYKNGDCNDALSCSNYYVESPVNSGNYAYDLDRNSIPSGKDILRETIANNEGREIIIVTVGFLGNVADLMNSSADQYSPKTGRQLIEDSVDLLIITGSNNAGNVTDFNFRHSLGNAVDTVNNWPGRIAQNPFTNGQAIFYPGESIANDFTSYRNPHILVDAYRDFGENSYDPHPFPYSRETWDQTSVMYAVEPQYFYAQTGTLSMDSNGLTYFDNSQGSDIFVTNGDTGQILNRMIEVATTVPGIY